MWSWLKYGRLANFVPADVNVLDNWVIEHLVELKHTPELLRSLWAGSDLPFPVTPSPSERARVKMATGGGRFKPARTRRALPAAQ